MGVNGLVIRLVRLAWRHRRGLLALGLAASAALAGFCYAVGLDEGTKNQLRKRLSEARKMPGRMAT